MAKANVVTALLILTLAASVAAAEPYKVIVNADNPVTEVSKATLRAYFLGKATRWSHGTTVEPVDLTESSRLRAEFSSAVLDKRIREVKSYWLTMIFSGRGTPPVQYTSEDEVVAKVRATPGAVGYVSNTAALGPGVKAISVTD